MSDQHQLLSTRQAASLLGVSVRTIQLWVEQGLLSAWKTPGGHRRIVQESLLGLLHKRQQLQPLAQLLCVNIDTNFFIFLQELCKQWHFPIELHQARNVVDALLIMGQFKPELLLMEAKQEGVDMQMLQQELNQHQVQLLLLSAKPLLAPPNDNAIWLTQPFDPVQLKAVLQTLLFARLRQSTG